MALRLGAGLRVDVEHGVFKCKSLGCKELGERGQPGGFCILAPVPLHTGKVLKHLVC